MRPRSLVTLLLAPLLFAASPAIAQVSGELYPSKTIRMIVNFPPGGLVDLFGRILATRLPDSLGQPVVVENRPGASGNIGADIVAKSQPDGYTLLMTAGSVLATNPHLFRFMPFDPLRDFSPITEVARIPNLLVVTTSLPARNVPEFLAYLRAHPGKVYYGGGIGTTQHISGEMLNRTAGVNAVHVPYKGTGPVYPDLVAGRIHFMFDGGAARPYIRSGKVRLIAVGSASRLALYPETPALGEPGGVPGFNQDSVHSLLAPAGTPREIILRLNREIVRVLRLPEVNEKIRESGAEVIADAPEEFAANLRADYQRFGEIIREMGIQID